MYRLRGLRSGVFGLLWVGIGVVLLMTGGIWMNCGSGERQGGVVRPSAVVRGSEVNKVEPVESRLYGMNADKPSDKPSDKQADRQAGKPADSSGLQKNIGAEDDNYDDNNLEEDSKPENPAAGIPKNLENSAVINKASSDAEYSVMKKSDEGYRLVDDSDNVMISGEKLTALDCHINAEYSVTCLKDNKEVYIPFSFINKYFEVSGKLIQEGGVEYFDWQHSHAQVYEPTEKYRTGGVLMSFDHYNVEVRNRVKCISGIEGVPVSTQWGAQGYFYPIQIAQYGLSHFSKYVIEQKGRTSSPVNQNSSRSNHGGDWSGNPVRAGLGFHMIFDAQEEDNVQFWDIQGTGKVRTETDKISNSEVLHFVSRDTSEVSLPVNDLMTDAPGTASKSRHSILSFSIRFISNASVTAVVEAEVRMSGTSTISLQQFSVHYVSSDRMITTSGVDIYYGLGRDTSEWKTLTRDLSIDLQKGVMLGFVKHRRKAPKIYFRRILKLVVYGEGVIANVSVARTAHLAQFYAAADWFLVTQDSRGGWPINVTRKLAEGFPELPPGWYSAMAQGQAMSVLARAYLHSRDSRYLQAALRAVRLFDVSSEDGGILTSFTGRFPWYEEYPTSPSSFVLNGFIYSLIGLYDLKEVALGSEGGRKAESVYRVGVASLRSLLSLFDTGSGSLYDLRHFSLQGVPPNVARWDYHATHINQLLLLSTIDESEGRLFETVARRWMGYMKGKRVPHN